jgi:hypothetical protein
VGRFGDSVLLIGGPTSEGDPFVEDLVATVEAGAAEGALPGAALAHRIGELLFRSGSGDVASFGVVAPVEGGVLVLLHGEVDAEIVEASGARRLSGRQAVTWVDQVVRAPFDSVALTEVPEGSVSIHPHSDLRVGIVPGAGFVLTPTGDAGGHQAVSPRVVGSEDDELPATEAVHAAMAAADDAIVPDVASRDSRPLFDQAAEQTPAHAEPVPANGMTIGPESPLGAEDEPSGPPHRSTATMATTGAAAELVDEEGSRTPLTGAYVLGREPSADEAVRSKKASPLQVDDPDQLVSRVHAHLWVDGGSVFVRDASSANGTFVAAPGARDWTRVGQERTELPLGWSIRLGGRVFTLEDDSVGRGRGSSL